jgi:prepilin-type N-terminal cleavage/methylation domain-containing protein
VIAMRTPLHLSPRLPRLAGRKGDDPARLAFTLIELLVVVVIITVLASLSLAGLAGARQRAKIDKTRSTIRKIDAIIRPMYDSYRTRRVLNSALAGVPTPNASQCVHCYDGGSGARATMIAAWKKLVVKRRMIVEEMPDNWGDVYSSISDVPSDSTAAPRRYARIKQNLISNVPRFTQTVPGQSSSYGNLYANAEALNIVALVGGFDYDAIENFRADEMRDIDGDTAAEFVDGWGRPIMFIRWPAAFTSILTDNSMPDPVDTSRTTADWALTPLIFSAGPDEATNDPLGTDSGYGLNLQKTWLGSTLAASYANVGSICSGNTQGSITSSTAFSDNITNHDLTKK